jgi:hypothetical protein
LRRGGESARHGVVRWKGRLGAAGIAPPVAGVGDSCDNALAETAIDLFKAEAIRWRGPWRNLDAVEIAPRE